MLLKGWVGYKDKLKMCNEFLKNMKHTCNGTVLNEWYDISYFNDDIERNCFYNMPQKLISVDLSDH